jgi:signal transduction histidine kinase
MARDDDLDEEIAKAIRARDDFFDAAAHELRTPLATLRLQLSILLEGKGANAVPEHMRKRLIAMQRQVDHLVRLTARFTDVVQLEHSDVPLSLERVDLAAVVKNTAARLEDQLRWAGCPLVVDAEPVEIVADSTRLDEVVSNLLTNAGKYASGQPVNVNVAAYRERATVCVIDRGPGIPADMKQAIFEKFTRGHEPRASGLGLGLWISKRIVEAHGGTLSVDDTPGGGVTFVMHLPRAVP